MAYIKDLVSCIVPTYKRANMILHAINSILNQTYSNLELLVVDDNEPGSEDSIQLERVLSGVEDPRFRLIRQEHHINGAAARNAGIREANGEFIAFLDDDDEWMLNKLTIQKAYLDEHPGYDAVAVLCSFYRGDTLLYHSKAYTEENLHYRVLSRQVSIFMPSVLFKREALDKSGYFDEALLRHQDVQLMVNFLRKNKMAVIDQQLVVVHTDSPTNAPNVDRLIAIKQAFFNSVNDSFYCYSKKERREILAAHYFEIVLVAAREKRIHVIMKYLFKIGIDVKAYKAVLKRYRERS